MLDRKTIKAQARSVLSQNYWTVVGAFLVYTLIALACSILGPLGSLVAMIVAPVIVVGLLNMIMRLYRGENVEFSDMFNGFHNFGHNLGGYWYMYLFTFLWTLLFIVPGIIKGIAYSMAPFILMDQPEVDPTEALNKSMQMTEGHKMDIFVMYLSFIGWSLLSIFTFGLLAIFFVTPYMMLTYAGYYVVLRNQEIYANGGSSYIPETFDYVSQVDLASNPYMASDYSSTVESEEANPYMRDGVFEENNTSNDTKGVD